VIFHVLQTAGTVAIMPKDTTSKLASLSSLYPFNVERQARKL